MSIWSTVMSVLTPIATALNIGLMPLIGIIAGIVAAIALIIVAIINWGDIWNWLCKVVGNICNSIGVFFSGLWQGICDIFSGIGQWFSDRFTEAYNFIVGIFSGIGQWFADRWKDICNVFSGVGQWFSDRFKEAFEGIKKIFSGIGQFFSGVWQGICKVFSNVAGWFKDKFSQAWQAVKNVFSAGGKVFEGIKDGILNGLKAIVNAIIRGINKVISIPFNGINSALKAIKGVDILGFKPFSWISTIGVPQIPELATGGVLYDETVVKLAEYSNSNSNPEIASPKNIMAETFDEVLSKYIDENSNKDRPINLAVYVGNKKLGQILLDDLRDRKRQTGKDIEALVGG